MQIRFNFKVFDASTHPFSGRAKILRDAGRKNPELNVYDFP